jgi:hypothetical protein
MDQDTLVKEPVVTQNDPAPAAAPQPDINKTLADSLWGVPQSAPTPSVATNTPAAPSESQSPAAPAEVNEPVEEVQTVDVDDYFRQNYGLTQSEFNEKWNKWKEYDVNPPAPATTEFKYENEDSRRFHELLKENKHEEVWRYLDQQRQIQQLETMNIANAEEAKQIIKANLRFKHADLNAAQIDRLFDRSYSFPKQPVQGDMDDADYAIEMNAWKNQIQQIEQDMVIDATIAKPELAKYKSNIVLPDIPRSEPVAPTTSQEELDRQRAWHNNYVAAVGSNYQNFKGYAVTAKDGDVSLPISYSVTPEEQMASKQLLENFNVSEFFDGRWFDQNGIPNVNKIQEDLYLLQNRDRIFQKIANEASAQRYLHHVKKQNNINLNTVNNSAPVPPANVDTRTDSQKLGDALWGKR